MHSYLNNVASIVFALFLFNEKKFRLSKRNEDEDKFHRIEYFLRSNEMNIYSTNESNWKSNLKEKSSDNDDEQYFSSPRKRSRPSLSQRLGLTDDSDQSDSLSQSSPNDQFNQKIFQRQNNL